MFKIKFNAIDTGANLVYCYYRDTSESSKTPPIEKSFNYERFIEIEPELKNLLEGDIYSLYVQDNYTEVKSTDGTYREMTDNELNYCLKLVNQACVELKYEDLLRPASIDEQIDTFIKGYFTEGDSKDQQKALLADFFKEIEESTNKE